MYQHSIQNKNKLIHIYKITNQPANTITKTKNKNTRLSNNTQNDKNTYIIKKNDNIIKKDKISEVIIRNKKSKIYIKQKQIL